MFNNPVQIPPNLVPFHYFKSYFGALNIKSPIFTRIRIQNPFKICKNARNKMKKKKKNYRIINEPLTNMDNLRIMIEI